MKELAEAHIIQQFAPDMTFVRFVAACQPTFARCGPENIVRIAGRYGRGFRMRPVVLAPVFFPDKAHRIFVGYDAVEQKWYYR